MLSVGEAMPAFAAVPCTVSAPALEVVFVGATGDRCRGSLMSCWDMPFERARPVRALASPRGRASFAGLWWSATTGRHVGYESWVERDVAMMLDFDRRVTGFSSQPFWLCWPGERRSRRHAPDFSPAGRRHGRGGGCASG
jgi:hypothetical protein